IPWVGAACVAWVLTWIVIGHGAYGDYGTSAPDDEHEVEWLFGWGFHWGQRGDIVYDTTAVAIVYMVAMMPPGLTLWMMGYPLGWVYALAGALPALIGLAAWTWPNRLPRGPWLDGPGAYLELAVGAVVVGGLAAVVAP
ncbi:MAG: hypothetical protein HQL39_15145, partial [Alphaproteobacteria bacterium]|nr:hypothetical protein [Alphaproteobacteria bacterium]